MTTRWSEFLHKHAGKGYTRSELSKMYRKKYAKDLVKESRARKGGEKLSARPKKFSKSVCRALVSGKVKVNMEEYHGGRYASPQQAIAVSYSQVQKKYPSCKRYLKRSVKK
jgi:hypothetical protein